MKTDLMLRNKMEGVFVLVCDLIAVKKSTKRLWFRRYLKMERKCGKRSVLRLLMGKVPVQVVG